MVYSFCAEGGRHRGGGTGIEKGQYVTNSHFPAAYRDPFQSLTRYRTQFLLVNKILHKISLLQGKAKK